MSFHVVLAGAAARSGRLGAIWLVVSACFAGCSGTSGDLPLAASPQVAAAPAAAVAPRVYFNGVEVDSDPDGAPAQVYRLYRAAFNRIADQDGLGFHVGNIEVFGRTLVDVAADFVASAEFASTYGSLDAAGFVTLLYHNVLNREPDPAGLSYWQAQLAAGASRAQVLIGFSESDENKAQTAAAVQAGLAFTVHPLTRVYASDSAYVETNADGTAAQVYRLYQAAFNRAADAQGLGYQVAAIERSGLSLVQLAQNFISSPEFVQSYGSLSDSQFVTQLYQNVLHRLPDSGGLQFYLAELAGGVSRAQVILGFSESPENKSQTLAAISAGMHFVPWPGPPSGPQVDLSGPLPAYGFDDTVALWGVQPAGIGGDANGDGGAGGSAGTGAPLAGATVLLVDAQGHTVSGITDSAGVFLLRFDTAVFKAPYVVKAVDAEGSVLASATATQAAAGTFVRINVSPLTDKIASDALDAAVPGTDKDFTGAAIDASKIALARQNLVTSIAGALGAAGVLNPATFDPVASAYAQDGTGIDAVVDSLAHTRDPVTGATLLSAKLSPLENDSSGSLVPTFVTASTPLSTSLVALPASAALTDAKLQAWVNAVNRCLGLTAAQTLDDPVCGQGTHVIASADYKHNSKSFREHLRMLASEADGSWVQGSSIRNPVVLYVGRFPGSTIDDLTVVEATVFQPRTGPLAGDIDTPLEYLRTLVFKRDDSLASAPAGNWIAYGEQHNYDWSVKTRYKRGIELNPVWSGNTATGLANATETRLNLSFSTRVYNRSTGTYTGSGVRAVRFTGPGLPAAGVVLVPTTSIGAGEFLAIHNKTGTIPTMGTTVGTASDSFGLAAVANDGSSLVGTAVFDPAKPKNSSTTPDFSKLGTFALYKVEIFLVSSSPATTPDAVEYTYNVGPVHPPTAALSFPYNDPSPSIPLATPSAQGAFDLLVQWANNFAAGPVYLAQVQADERTPKGATTGFTTTNWNTSRDVFAAYSVLSRPVSQSVSASPAFPSLTTQAGDDREIAIWSHQSRALIQNVVRWDN